MKRFKFIGTLAFYLTLPGLYFYLQKEERTRVVVKVGDEILVLKGWYGSNKWMLPGGGAHKGEENVIAAVRELEEETGIQITPDQLTYVTSGDVRDSYNLRYKYHLYTLELKERPVINIVNTEISDSDWQKPGQIVANEKGVLKATRTTLGTWLEHQNLV